MDLLCRLNSGSAALSPLPQRPPPSLVVCTPSRPAQPGSSVALTQAGELPHCCEDARGDCRTSCSQSAYSLPSLLCLGAGGGKFSQTLLLTEPVAALRTTTGDVPRSPSIAPVRVTQVRPLGPGVPAHTSRRLTCQLTVMHRSCKFILQ